MATTYTLPDIIIKRETYSVQFLGAADGLTMPTRKCCIDIGKFKEQMDGYTHFGRITPQNVQLSFIDFNYFFSGIIAGGADIKISRNGNLEFYGFVDKESPEWDQYFVSGSDVRQKVKFTCLHMIHKLKNYTADNVIQKIILRDENHPHTTGSYYTLLDYGDFVTVADLFRPFMMDYFGTTFGDAIPEIINNDFKYDYKEGLSYSEKDFLTGVFVKLGSGSGTNEGYFDSSSEIYLGKKFSTALDLLVAMAKTFGFVPKIYFDTTSSEWRLQLKTRRQQTYSAGSDIPNLLTSKKVKAASLARNIWIHNPFSGDNGGYVYYKGTVQHLSAGNVPPSDVQFDYEFTPLWVVTTAGGVSDGYKLFYLENYTVESITFKIPLEINNVRAYRYNYYDWDYNNDNSISAHLTSFGSQFNGSKEEFTRAYKSIVNHSIFDIISFSNGVATKDYLVNSREFSPKDKTETYNFVEV